MRVFLWVCARWGQPQWGDVCVCVRARERGATRGGACVRGRYGCHVAAGRRSVRDEPTGGGAGVSERLKCNGSLARAAIKELVTRGLVRAVSMHHAQSVRGHAAGTGAGR